MIDHLTHHGLARAHELSCCGVSAKTIARSMATGETVRAGRGLCQLANAELDVHGTLADVSKLAPKGVICLPDFDIFLPTTCFYVLPPIFEALHFAGFPLLAIASIDSVGHSGQQELQYPADAVHVGRHLRRDVAAFRTHVSHAGERHAAKAVCAFAA